MSISPPSDIVLGVANAADPQKYRAAVEKLADISGTSAAEASRFVTETVKAAAASAAGKAQSSPGITQALSAPIEKADTTAKPHEQFEAYFLQTFVDAMLPKEGNAMFGSGPGSKIWRSMMAEYVAKELANGTSFGIAETIAEHRNIKDSDEAKPSPAAQSSTDKPAARTEATGSFLTDLQKLLAAEGELAVSRS